MTHVESNSDLSGFALRLDAQSDFFAAGEPITIARAPGRLDVMGGIADYSGALVLELPLQTATFVAVQPTTDRCLTVRSLAPLGADVAAEVKIMLDALAPRGKPLEYGDARVLLAGDGRWRWAAYVVGTWVVLARERGLRLARGARILIDSTVPVGKGVSSSAALEVATMYAAAAVYGISLSSGELAKLCQKVENFIVGAPCGIMDQMSAACGERDRLLALLCQPAEIQGQVVLPTGLELWGVDSGIRHQVGGADYGAVRTGAFMGYRIIADQAGLATTVREGRVQVDDPIWRGYLANIVPSEWESRFRSAVPELMDGSVFLQRYGGTTDSVTSVDSARAYAVRQCTAHPIYEHHRVCLFRALLETGAASEEQRLLLGELMYQSHASYSACGLGSSGTDHLVQLVREAGAAAGVYGAKITGGGSGGVVAVLARAGSRAAVEEIARAYLRLTGRPAMVLGGSSDGAIRFGTRRYE